MRYDHSLVGKPSQVNVKWYTEDSSHMCRDQTGEEKLSRAEFRERLIELGFSLSDLLDDELTIVFDKNNDGFVSVSEFLDFVKDGLDFQKIVDSDVHTPPEDDLQYIPRDLSGQHLLLLLDIRSY